MTFKAISFLAAPTPEAENAKASLVRQYGDTAPKDADVIVALGGDGMMLHTIHDTLDLDVPIYGMNRGSVGFMMNAFDEDDLKARLNRAQLIELHPLKMTAIDTDGRQHTELALNEVSLLR